MSERDAAEVAGRFVAAQEALLTALERSAGAAGAAEVLERASARCAAAFETFRELHAAGAAMPVDTVARARRLAALLNSTAERRSDVLALDLRRARTARRVLDSAAPGPRGRVGGSCDMAG